MDCLHYRSRKVAELKSAFSFLWLDVFIGGRPLYRARAFNCIYLWCGLALLGSGRPLLFVGVFFPLRGPRCWPHQFVRDILTMHVSPSIPSPLLREGLQVRCGAVSPYLLTCREWVVRA